MFTNTIDNKNIITDQNGDEIVDLTESIFGTQKGRGLVYSLYKVPKTMEMRIDLISNALYGSSDYAEMVLKYSDIPNPFAIQEGDLVIIPSMQTVYNDVETTILENTSSSANVDLVKKYHKYIDTDKVPDTIGSETNTTTMTKNSTESDTEANISSSGSSGISIVNGRIYFGDSVSVSASDVTDVDGTNSTDSSLVSCARSGVTLGQFLTATISNRNNR